MALRLRRGTDAERQIITPAEGELIYTTDTKLLYVGDGSTVGGTLVTGSSGGGATTLNALTDTDLAGTEDGDVLSFNAGTNRWQPIAIPDHGDFSLDDLNDVFIREDAAPGDILKLDGAGNFSTQPFSEFFAQDQNWRINVIGDDSTIIIDSDTNDVTGNFFGNLTGDVFGDVLGDVTGNLVGDVTGTVVGDLIGNITATGTLDGDVTGSVFGDVTGTVVGDLIGNITATGTLDGDVTGSVFGDDSTLIVDGITNTITADSVNTSQINSSTFGPIVLQNDFRTPVRLTAVTDGSPGGFPYTEYLSVKGSLDDPLSLEANDIIGGWKITAWDAASQQGKATTIMASRLMADAVITDTTPNSLTSIVVGGGGTNQSSFDFFGSGQFKSPGAITPGVYADAAARDADITSPTAGMMVYITDVAKFQGYDGSAWINLN